MTKCNQLTSLKGLKLETETRPRRHLIWLRQPH